MPLCDSYIRVGILCQSLQSPVRRNVRRPEKPSGYADSGADIAYALHRAGVEVMTPTSKPRPDRDSDWVFYDSRESFDALLASKANVLWANTPLFTGHPLDELRGAYWIVGQEPRCADIYDDKWITNRRLTEMGCNVARSILVGVTEGVGEIVLTELSQVTLQSKYDIGFPLIAKPVRGRGSEAVVYLDSWGALRSYAMAGGEFVRPRFGDTFILEEFLPGDEITICVFPPHRSGDDQHLLPSKHWCLPPVRRFNHRKHVAPYSGEVPVSRNSAPLSDLECQQIGGLLDECSRVGGLLGCRAPIRIDCRQDRDGIYKIFDVNLKPNLTGPGRPSREFEASLVSIAAEKFGWSYLDLVVNILNTRWHR